MKRDESDNGKGPYRENDEPCEAVITNRRRFRGLVEDFRFPKRVNEHPKHVVYLSGRIEEFEQLIPPKTECKTKGVGL